MLSGNIHVLYIVVVVCNVNSPYKSQECRLSYCCSTTLQPATSCIKYIIIFGQIIYIFSRRGLGRPTSYRADNAFNIFDGLLEPKNILRDVITVFSAYFGEKSSVLL